MDQDLRLTPFEESLLLDDRLSYPWSCFLRARFTGCLRRDAFEAAVQTVVSRHPLVASLIEQRRRKLWWKQVSNPQPRIAWFEQTLTDEYPTATHLDPRKEIGVRFMVTVDTAANASDVVIQFHHASCDGKGGFQLLDDLLTAYAAACGGTSEGEETEPAAPLRELRPEQLKHRNRFGLTLWRCLRMVPSQLSGLIGAWQFLGRTAASLLPQEKEPDDGPLPDGYPAAHVHWFDRAETKAILDAAKQVGSTVNDLLSRDFILAMNAWRKDSGIGTDEDWLRLMVPMSMRSDVDRCVSAANIMSTVFLDRRREDCADPAQLLTTIRDQMNLIKDRELGFTYLFSLLVARSLPGGLARFHWDDRCVATAILSNLGKPLANSPLPLENGRIMAGNLTLERVEALAPLRPHTCVSVTLMTCGDRLAVAMHYDPRAMTAQQSAELLQYYSDAIAESSGMGRPETEVLARRA